MAARAPLVRRELRGRPGRAALVAATVVVAVAFCVGAFGFASQVRELVAPPSVDAGLQLPEGSVVLTADTSSLTTPTALDDSLLARVRGVAGVGQANANYDQPLSFVVPSDSQPERPPVLRGVVLSSTSDPARWRLAEGRFPQGPFEVALDLGGELVGETGMGGRSRLKLPVGSIEVDVVGVVEPIGATSTRVPVSDAGIAAVALSSAHVVLDPEWAPRMLDAEGRADRITVIPLPGTSPDALASRLREAVPEGVSVLAATSRLAQTQHTIASIDSDVQAATYAYAGLTVLVGALVVANSYSVVVAQRVRELGLLRLVGASRPQVVRTVLGEAVVVGLVGAVLGAAGGTLLAYVAARVVHTGGVEVGFTFTAAMAVVAVVVGLTTSVVGSLWPALRAGRVPPIEALSDTLAGADRPSHGLLPALATLAGFGVAAWVAATSVELTASRLAVVGLAAVVGFAGLALLSRWVVVPVVAVVGAPVVAAVGVTARLGIGNARRQPSRTAGAASTLMVGLALVATVATFGESAHRAIDAQVGAAGRADLYVERRGVVRVSTRAVDQVLRNRRGVVDVAEFTTVDGVVVGPDGDRTSALASDPVAADRIVDLDVVSGRPDPDGVLLAVDTADRLGAPVGSSVELRSVSGSSRRLRVTGTYRNTAVAGPAVVPYDVARTLSADGTFEVAAVRVHPRAPLDRVRHRLEREMSTFPRVGADTPEGFARLSTSVTDAVVRIVTVLLGGALGIGVLGLASTLALSTLERRRELVMLRAVGASARQVRVLVWLEATMIGVIAAVVGVGAGTIVGRVGVGFAPGTLGGSAAVPWVQLAAVAVGAVVVAWLVSLGVARRAATVPPAEAGRV